MDKFLNTDPKNLEEFLTNTRYKYFLLYKGMKMISLKQLNIEIQ
jgi:hypothetical protein